MSEDVLLQKLTPIAEPVVQALGLEIWGIEIVRASRMVIRIFVDVPQGEALHVQQGHDDAVFPHEEAAASDALLSPQMSASLGQCEEISRHVGLALEVEDVLPSAYVLEVSTPGFARIFFQLAQMRSYLGDVIDVALSEPLAEEGGRKRFRGVLREVGEDTFSVQLADISAEGDILVQEKQVSLPWAFVRKASRVYVYTPPPKPGKRKKNLADQPKG